MLKYLILISLIVCNIIYAVDDIPLLTYSIDPGHVEVAAADVKLTIKAINERLTGVVVDRIEFDFPKGRGANDLTNSSINILEPGAGWSESNDGFTFTVFPPEFPGAVVPPDGQESNYGIKVPFFEFRNITVNEMATSSDGPVTIKVTERARLEQDKNFIERVQDLKITKVPAGLFIKNLSADPLLVDCGGETIISWEGNKEASYSVVWYDGREIRKVDVRGSDNTNFFQVKVDGLYEPLTVITIHGQFAEADNIQYELGQVLVQVKGTQPTFSSNLGKAEGGSNIKLSWSLCGAKEAHIEANVEGYPLLKNEGYPFPYPIPDSKVCGGDLIVTLPNWGRSVTYTLIYQDRYGDWQTKDIEVQISSYLEPGLLINIDNDVAVGGGLIRLDWIMDGAIAGTAHIYDNNATKILDIPENQLRSGSISCKLPDQLGKTRIQYTLEYESHFEKERYSTEFIKVLQFHKIHDIMVEKNPSSIVSCKNCLFVDGEYLTVINPDGTAQRINLPNPKDKNREYGPIRQLYVAGGYLYALHSNNNVISVVNADTHKLTNAFRTGGSKTGSSRSCGFYHKSAVSADDYYLVVADCQSNQLELWEVPEGKLWSQRTGSPFNAPCAIATRVQREYRDPQYPIPMCDVGSIFVSNRYSHSVLWYGDVKPEKSTPELDFRSRLPIEAMCGALYLSDRYLYVAVEPAANKSISVFEIPDTKYSNPEVELKSVARIPLNSKPIAFCWHRNRQQLYVAQGYDYQQGRITVIDSKNNVKIGGDIMIGMLPKALMLDKNGKYLFIVNTNSGTMSIIDGIRHKKIKDITVGTSPVAMAQGSDGNMYVVNSGSNTVSVIKIETE